MAPKKISKTAKTLKTLDYKALSLTDALCPICRSILIEPVTLPCRHNFCLSCFDGTMENANLVCPLCRIRIGSWLRKAKKGGKLVNNDLWSAIQESFPRQVKNKLSGVDENLEEGPEIIVSYPGEIRKEYEIQKRKEDEEFRRKCAVDIKAMLSWPTKKIGPMDKFVKQETETVTSQSAQKKALNNFATKEYTCRVLYLDTNKKAESDFHKKPFSPLIKKKIQQIQKIVDTDIASDSSDCIESELRYFKPIDHRVNPPSEGKPPIKVPSRKPANSSSATILSPSGMINFHSNFLESAFARISFTIPTTSASKGDNSATQSVSDKISRSLKRTRSDSDVGSLEKRKTRRKAESEEHDDKESPTLNTYSKSSKGKKQPTRKSNNTVQIENSISPPFYGFDLKSDLKK
ncbi:hypothetical protein NQ318_008905 [Aromia moschata]|uniref:RING-type E3 ubiquitin transferase n=1 Tax=Aromia moschata TaxID=1265417 RepID=A0AAV8ZCB0_9CUCU|nr:hypothetical protein NQ318_008905 [Aromia moschata]